MMELALRRLRRHWRLNLALLLCLTLASALLAGVSGYGAAIAAQELSRTLEEAGPADRTLLITGTPYTFRSELYQSLQQSLGKILKDRLVIRHAMLPADPLPSSEETGRKQAVARVDVYSLDPLSEVVRVVEGRLPTQVSLNAAVGNWPPPMEAVIGQRAAEQSGHDIGDRVTARGTYHRLDIVGIVVPIDPHDDLWGGDMSAFAVITDTRHLGADAIALPLIIAPESMQSYLNGPVFPHQVFWRITLNRQRIGPDTAEMLQSELINFQTQAATRGATTNTGLLPILADFLARLSRLRVALWLLTAQTLILVLYTLTTFTSFVVDRSQVEVATLSARGMSVWQITRVFALEYLILALPAALLLGPGLAQAVVHLWSKTTGTVLPNRLSGEMWLLSIIAAGVGWLALALSIFMAARRTIREPQATSARPPQQSVLHKRYVDLCLLVFGGVLVWQLSRSGSFLARTVAGSRLGNTPLADPLLLLGPFLLAIAMAMIALRIVPFLLGLVARLFQHQRGLVLPLGLLRPARNPLQPSRVVLLVSLTVGLVLFARIFGDSLTHSQEAPRSAALVQGIAGAFQLNALMLALFSVTTFFLAHLIAALGQERSEGSACEFHILRAVGLSARQWPILSVVEGILVLSLGLLAGAVVGLGLSYTMIPYLSQALVAPLVEPLAGVTIERIVVDWPIIARLYAVLIALYGSALALLWMVLGRERVHPAPWLEDR
jgi:hypothetical protein